MVFLTCSTSYSPNVGHVPRHQSGLLSTPRRSRRSNAGGRQLIDHQLAQPHFPKTSPALGAPQVRRVSLGLFVALGVVACGGVGVQPRGVAESAACSPDPEGVVDAGPIPERAPPAAVTTGEVPHRQMDPQVNQLAIAELQARVLEIPEVELGRSGNVMDATEIRIRDGVDIKRPECLIGERAVAHIHFDGSLHGVVPHSRIAEAQAAGWIEPHPWAGVRPGFEAYVLIFTPRSSEEVDVVLDLVSEGLRFVSGSEASSPGSL